MSVHDCHFNYELQARLATPKLLNAYLSLVEYGIESAARAVESPSIRDLRAWWEVYLIASYLYYVKDVSLLTDHQFDYLVKKLASVDEQVLLGAIRTYGLYDSSALVAGSGYHIKTLPYFALYGAELYEKRLNDYS